jgi:predicted transcriptional regulator
MPPGRQLNIRLSPAARDRLEALAFLRRVPSSTLARDIVLEYLERFRDEPGLQAALKALIEHDAAGSRTAEVAAIDSRRRRKPDGAV